MKVETIRKIVRVSNGEHSIHISFEEGEAELLTKWKSPSFVFETGQNDVKKRIAIWRDIAKLIKKSCDVVEEELGLEEVKKTK